MSPGSDFYRTLLDTFPSPVFVVEEDVRIVDMNLAGKGMLHADGGLVFRRRAGEALHCLHATDSPGGCGQGPFCKDCVVRTSVNMALQGVRVVRRHAKMELVSEGKMTGIQGLVTAAPFTFDGRRLALLILEDASELLTLRELLPICANCKRIRDDRDYWQKIESYLGQHLDLRFSHGICPACMALLYPEYAETAEATADKAAGPED